MKLAILFWFYDDIELCRNRLEILRVLNKDVPIFGLFGGSPKEAGNFERSLYGLLDDFYAFEEERDGAWKWKNGDLMIADWFRNRGHRLDWDTVTVVQWDMLVLGPVKNVFSMLKPGEILLSGLRPAKEVVKWWPWMDPRDPEVQRDLQSFIRRLERDYHYQEDLWCCLFLVACLPRRFLDLYVKSGPPDDGFWEYRLPTMARVFGIPFCLKHPFKPWWGADPSTRRAPPGKRLLNAVRVYVSTELLTREATTNGAKIFHPYEECLPVQTACRLAEAAAAISGGERDNEDAGGEHGFMRESWSRLLGRLRPNS